MIVFWLTCPSVNAPKYEVAVDTLEGRGAAAQATCLGTLKSCAVKTVSLSKVSQQIDHCTSGGAAPLHTPNFIRIEFMGDSISGLPGPFLVFLKGLVRVQ
jgi:hypothetical protein